MMPQTFFSQVKVYVSNFGNVSALEEVSRYAFFPEYHIVGVFSLLFGNFFTTAFTCANVCIIS